VSAAHAGELCAAYGCPMIAAIGAGSRWYCACHFRHPISAFDAITAELHRHKPLVDAAIYARRSCAGYIAIRDAENALIAFTGVICQQYALKPTPGHTAGVNGPATEGGGVSRNTSGEHAEVEQ
jgi:hypothetical protein